MTDSTWPTWFSSQELEAIVGKAVAERIDPLRAQLVTVGRGLGILAERAPRPQDGDRLAARVEALTARVEELASLEHTLRDGLAEVGAKLSESTAVSHAVAALERTRAADTERLLGRMAAVEDAVVSAGGSNRPGGDDLLEGIRALERSLQRDAEERAAQTRGVRQALAVAVDHVVAKVEQARAAEAGRLVERIDALSNDLRAREAEVRELRKTMATALERAVARMESAVADAASRARERGSALEPLGDDEARKAEAAGVRTALAAILEAARQVEAARVAEAATLERALTQLEAARVTDASRLVEHVAARFLEQVTALVDQVEADARRRETQAAALVTALDEQTTSRLERHTAAHVQAVLAHLDERSALSDLEAIPAQVTAAVQAATANALTTQVEPLVARLVEACDSLAREGARIEALALAQGGEARAVEERVAALVVEVAERTQSAVDHSRGRIAEGQVALSTRFDGITRELLSAVAATAGQLDARLTETADGLRASSDHQNAAVLDALNRNAQQLDEQVAAVRSVLLAGRDEQRAAVEAVAGVRPEALRSAVEDAAHELRAVLDDLRASQVVLRDAVEDGAHKAEMTAIDIRGLRDRLAPHLVALEQATNRRAEADRAGFDAVLARLDQLLTAQGR